MSPIAVCAPMDLMRRNGATRIASGKAALGQEGDQTGHYLYISIITLGSEGRTTELCSLQTPVVVKKGDLGHDLSVTCLHRLGN